MTTTIPGRSRTYSTQEAADILGVSPGLLYKIGRDRSRPEFREYGCVKVGIRTQWSKERIDAAASGRNAA
jgi:hypothetical protein